jgi:hypothetical protein
MSKSPSSDNRSSAAIRSIASRIWVAVMSDGTSW